jgi:hypothetical protein
MDADDAWSVELRRLLAIPDLDPLALDEVSAERLLAGDLDPDQAPPGYAEVAALLAATVAAPSPAELAGQQAALAQLQAVVRAHRARTRGSGKPSRRRRVGLVVAVAAAALSTGGIAAAATGHLPHPIRDAARSIFAAQGDTTPIPLIKPGRQPATGVGDPDTTGASTDRQGQRLPGEPGPTAMTNVPNNPQCRAKAGKGTGKNPDAADHAFRRSGRHRRQPRHPLPAIPTRRHRDQRPREADPAQQPPPWAGQQAASQHRQQARPGTGCTTSVQQWQSQPGRPPDTGHTDDRHRRVEGVREGPGRR